MYHKDLQVWQRSIEFVTDIYKILEAFPKTELYALTDQIKRASISISSNIAE
jgi:four helix bundle protein